MIGNLSSIKHEKISSDNVSVGDIFEYMDGHRRRYFGVLEVDLTRVGEEVRIKEFCSSNSIEEPRRHLSRSPYGNPFVYNLNSAIRDFTKVSYNADRIAKAHLCKVVAAILFATDELRNLLIELEI